MHTLGPWTLQTVRTSSGVCFKVGPFPWKNGKLNHACIYADYPSPGSKEFSECLANAKLIASAPELLQALKDAVAALGGMNSDNVPETARAAIAKATGE